MAAWTALPALLAFCVDPRRALSPRRRASSLATARRAAPHPPMPPLLSNATSSSRLDVLKALRRDVYPTIDLPRDCNDTAIDHYFMGMALQQAQRAWDRGEVPIGALLVRELSSDADGDGAGDDATPPRPRRPTTTRTFQILSQAHNRVEMNFDASAHAELLALRRGARNLRNWRYPPHSRLYSTLEPCPMCLASVQAFRVDHVVYGAPDKRLGAVETHLDLLGAATHPYHAVKSVTGGVRERECGDIMVRFFRERRRRRRETAGGRRRLLKLPLEKRAAADGRGGRWRRVVSRLKTLLRPE